MLEYVWNEYVVEFKYRNKRVLKSKMFLDVVGERRRVGDSVTVNVNHEKRIGIIKAVA
jgi:hypothetical protein